MEVLRYAAFTRTPDGGNPAGVVLDATNGEEVGRTDTYEFLDVASIGADAEGFVLQAGSAEGTQLLHVDTDAQVSVIDEGFYLVPVVNGAEVTYLKYAEDLTRSSLRTWSPGDEESEQLLAGYVGAGSPDGEHVLASKETPDGTEFWRQDGGTGEMSKVLTLPLGADDADP